MPTNVDAWNLYFGGLASAATALLAIAFFTFQFRADIWRKNRLKQAVARTTLVELAAPVFFGLMFLMPTHPWIAAGRIVGIVGYLVMTVHLACSRAITRPPTASTSGSSSVWR